MIRRATSITDRHIISCPFVYFHTMKPQTSPIFSCKPSHFPNCLSCTHYHLPSFAYACNCQICIYSHFPVWKVQTGTFPLRKTWIGHFPGAFCPLFLLGLWYLALHPPVTFLIMMRLIRHAPF